MSSVNISCSPVNLDPLVPHDMNYAYVESNWNSANVTAMTSCCAPQEATETGCYTWCKLDDDDDISSSSTRQSWEDDIQECLTREGSLISNGSFVAPKVTTVKNSNTAPQIGSGVKGVVLFMLGVTYWLMA